jgi:hypothetical protein
MIGILYGKDHFRCISPQGTSYELEYTVFRERIISQNGNLDYYQQIVGPNGTWEFSIDQFGIGSAPHVSFLGADVKLPDMPLKGTGPVPPVAFGHEKLLHGNDAAFLTHTDRTYELFSNNSYVVFTDNLRDNGFSAFRWFDFTRNWKQLCFIENTGIVRTPLQAFQRLPGYERAAGVQPKI